MRKRYKLTAAKVTAIKTPGRHSDGGNLILRVSKEGNKSWAFRYCLDHRERTAGLGPLHRVPLAEARTKAEAMGRALAAGLDPLDERNKERAKRRAEAARLLTFREATRRFLADREGGWRNEQHRKDVTNSVERYVLPIIGGVSVADIDTPAVLKVLEAEDFWRSKPETANKVRGRIEAVIDWATARSFRNGPNPAKWRGHLDAILPAVRVLRPIVHHPALDWRQLPGFMKELRGRDGLVARTVEFTILCTARIGEVLGATWDEFDLSERLWRIPASRMKSHRPHTVPLSPRALEILRSMPRAGERVFPTGKATTGKFLRERMGRPDITLHGTARATFSTWCAENTNYPADLREACLAHQTANKVIAAYQRGTLLEKRRKLMAAWAAYCGSTPVEGGGKVLTLKRVG
jgi:integrase